MALESNFKKLRKKFYVFSRQNWNFSQTSILTFEKWKKVDFFDFFSENMKSRVLPKFYVNVDWYYNFEVFFILSKMTLESDLKKIKEKNSPYFLDKTDISARHRFWVSKNEKKWVFSAFFLKTWNFVFCPNLV